MVAEGDLKKVGVAALPAGAVFLVTLDVARGDVTVVTAFGAATAVYTFMLALKVILE